MTSYRVLYSKAAEKFIRQNKAVGIRFMKAFSEIASDMLLISRYDIKRYHHKDYDDIFRLRIGKYRVIFRVIQNEIVISVIDIGSRGDIYKKGREG